MTTWLIGNTLYEIVPYEEVLAKAPINDTHYQYYHYGKCVRYYKLTKKGTWVMLEYGKKWGLAKSHAESLGGEIMELKRS